MIPLIRSVAAEVADRAVGGERSRRLLVAGGVEHRNRNQVAVICAQGILHRGRVHVAGRGDVEPLRPFEARVAGGQDCVYQLGRAAGGWRPVQPTDVAWAVLAERHGLVLTGSDEEHRVPARVLDLVEVVAAVATDDGRRDRNRQDDAAGLGLTDRLAESGAGGCRGFDVERRDADDGH